MVPIFFINAIHDDKIAIEVWSVLLKGDIGLARPPKWRRVEYIPNIQYFIPADADTKNIQENILRMEEVEAIRLKDTEKLEQEECAQRMGISRQTFQRILSSGREKLADSIINGKAIRIDGGVFTRNICPVHCLDCNKEWEESYENFGKIFNGTSFCPDCQSGRIVCNKPNGWRFCKGNCHRGGQE